MPAAPSGGDEPDRGERRDRQHHRVRLAVPRGGLARYAARVAHVAAAVEGRVGVEDLAVVAGAGDPDPVAGAGDRGEVARAQEEALLPAGEAAERHHALLPVAAVDPLEAGRLE